MTTVREGPAEMPTPNLYHVQDDHRPMFVVAMDWQGAVNAWRYQLRREAVIDNVDDDEEPKGVTLVARGGDPECFPEFIIPKGVVPNV